jgi:hypothetical protein
MAARQPERVLWFDFAVRRPRRRAGSSYSRDCRGGRACHARWCRSAIDSTITYVKRAKEIHAASADAKTYSESLKAAFPDRQLAGFVDLSAGLLYAARR